MFDKEYVFRGKHAEMVNRLTGTLSDDIGRGIFRYNYQVYAVAPLIGFLYKRKAAIDRSTEATTKIFRDKMMDEADNSKYNYRLIMLLHEKNKYDIEERKRRAFKLDSEDALRAPFDALFDEYVRGGVEVLYEKIFTDETSVEGYIQNMYEFFDDFNERYYEEVGDLE